MRVVFTCWEGEKTIFIHSHVLIVELMMIVSLYKCRHFTRKIIHK